MPGSAEGSADPKTALPGVSAQSADGVDWIGYGVRAQPMTRAALAPDGAILAIDEIGARWMGFTPDQIIGRPVWLLSVTHDRAVWDGLWDRLTQRTRLRMTTFAVGDAGPVSLEVMMSLVSHPTRGAYAMLWAWRVDAPELAAPIRADLERRRFIATRSEDGYFDWDVINETITLSAQYCRLLGLPPREVVHPTFIAERIHPDDMDRAVAETMRLLDGEQDTLDTELRMRREDGSYIWVLSRSQVVARSGSGTLQRVIGRMVDISRARRAEERADTEHQLFEAVLNTSVAAITLLDRTGQLIFANARAEHILGISRSAILDRTFDAPEWRITDLDGGPWPESELPFVRVMATSAAVYGVRHAIEWPDGRRRVLSINGEPVFDRDGRINQVLFSITDITDELVAERALQQSEKRLKDTLARVSVGVILHSPRAEPLVWNQPALDMLGMTEDQLAQRTALDTRWDIVHENGRVFPGHELPVPRAIAGGKPVRDVVMGVGRTDRPDERVWLRVHAEPALDADGNVLDVVCEFQNITTERRLEAKLRRSDRLEGLGRLAGGVAHDFNNLLTAVTGNAELAITELASDHPAREDLEEIRHAARRGAALTRQLLGYARKQAIKPRDVALDAVVCGSASLLERVIGEDVEVDIRSLQGLWPVRLDPDQFDQVLVNLAVNARQAMPRGGRITVTLGNVEVVFDDQSPELDPGEYVRLWFDDTGPGMPADVAQNAFEPFFTTRPSGEGTGLGLSVCYGIVSQNQGRISILRNEEGGCRIEILLPRSFAEGDRVERSIVLSARPLRSTGTERVLIVEDDPAVRAMARRVLHRQGYDVQASASGPEALTLMGESSRPPVDVVVTDVVMPGMSGPTLVRALHARWPDLPVLYTSGHADDLLGEHGVVIDDVRLLSKPYTGESLSMAMRKLLDADHGDPDA